MPQVEQFVPLLVSCLLLAPMGAQTAARQAGEAGLTLAKMQLLNGFAGGDDLKPWHIKANYEIYNDAEEVTATGTFEEWWAGHDKWRRTYTGHQYTASEYHLSGSLRYEGWPILPYTADEVNGEPNLDAGMQPWPEALIANKLLYPFTRPVYSENSWQLVSARFDSPVYSSDATACITLNAESALLNEEYCRFSGSLELKSSLFHFVCTQYGRKISFQGRLVPIDMSISLNHHSLLKVHVTALEEMQAGEGDTFMTSSPAASSPAACNGSFNFISAMSPMLDRYPELYPLQVRKRNVEGTVVMQGMLDKNGYLINLQVVESPDPLLSAASLRSRARHSGPFEPSTQDGEPVACPWSAMDVYTLSK